MKKKLIPMIFGLAMLAALPLTAKAEGDESPEPESGNVSYTGGFAETRSSDVKRTELVTAIPAYTLTIPRDTSIKRGARIATIGHAKVTGNYFIKPYGVEVSLTKVDFTHTTDSSKKIAFAVEDTSESSGNHAYVTADGATRNKCRYYKTIVSGAESTATYDTGDIADINQSRDVVLKIADAQWQGATTGGLYKGSITFLAQLCDDVTTGDWEQMSNS